MQEEGGDPAPHQREEGEGWGEKDTPRPEPWGEDGSQTAGVGDQGKERARGGTAKPRGRVDGGRADAKGT